MYVFNILHIIKCAKTAKQFNIQLKFLFLVYNGGQKISSTTVIPLTYAVKQPLGTNNLTLHVDMCQSNCVYVLMGDNNKFQILICKRQS
jgi:hypothetical protein